MESKVDRYPAEFMFVVWSTVTDYTDARCGIESNPRFIVLMTKTNRKQVTTPKQMYEKEYLTCNNLRFVSSDVNIDEKLGWW